MGLWLELTVGAPMPGFPRVGKRFIVMCYTATFLKQCEYFHVAKEYLPVGYVV
jgi:hypothetical protein